MIITDIETNKKLTWIEIGFWRTNTDYNISIKQKNKDGRKSKLPNYNIKSYQKTDMIK